MVAPFVYPHLIRDACIYIHVVIPWINRNSTLHTWDFSSTDSAHISPGSSFECQGIKPIGATSKRPQYFRGDNIFDPMEWLLKFTEWNIANLFFGSDCECEYRERRRRKRVKHEVPTFFLSFLQRPPDPSVLQGARQWEGLHLLDARQPGHAQVRQLAPVRRGQPRVPRNHGDGTAQPDRLHQLEPVLHGLQAGRQEPLPRGHLLRQHRSRLGGHFPGKSQTRGVSPFLHATMKERFPCCSSGRPGVG